MSKTRKQYTKEFKLEALQLWEPSEKSAADIESDPALARWPRYGKAKVRTWQLGINDPA
ncbi:MAG: hypothetical protein AAF902_06640 [Chloroflexota bacterium]